LIAPASTEGHQLNDRYPHQNETMPQVSVIVPCYNHARYLPQALHSVLSQTFSDWEAIIVDDGSTDNTRDIAARFSDPRVQYKYQENRGLSAARNAGIRAARGQYLAFLDADDAWAPEFLEACVAKLAAVDTAAAVVTLCRFIDEDGVDLPRVGGRAVSSEAFRACLMEGGFFPPNAALVRAHAAQRAGPFDENLTSLEDWDLWLRIAALGGLVLCIPKPLARYRVTANSMSTDAVRMHRNRIAVLTKHFGAAQGEPIAWAEEKRKAYAFGYRCTALGYLEQQQTDTAWRWLEEAVATWPQLLNRLDTLYELALGDQPRGHRGQASLLDVRANREELLDRLESLFVGAPPDVRALRATAYGNAYLALAMLSDQAEDWAAARCYLGRAIRSNPALLLDALVVRRGAKLLLGRRVIAEVRRRRLESAVKSGG
jgi:GT2 family glycosyltransferase